MIDPNGFHYLQHAKRFLGAAVLGLLCATVAVAAKPPASDAFVRVVGGHFEKLGRPYAFAGVNFWYAAYLGTEPGNQVRLARELDQLQALGVTNLRILGASEPTPYSPLTPTFQPKPGVYNEALLRGLDYALDQISRRGMTVVIYLNNQWEWSGGMSTYVNWATGAIRPRADIWPDTINYDTRFYTLPRAQKMHRAYVSMLLRRVNSVNGRRYTEDPTIMAWELSNEPRAGTDGQLARDGSAYITWIEAISAFIRQQAPHQLITTGSEGIVATSGSVEFYEKVHALPTIDYLTVHIWPFNWRWFNPRDGGATFPATLQRTREYLDKHIVAATMLKKPLVLEEFGLQRDSAAYMPGTPTTQRDAYIKSLFDVVKQSVEAGGPLCGTNLWSWSGEGVPVDPNGAFWKAGTPFCGDNGIENQGLNSIYGTDASTLDLLKTLAATLNAANAIH